VTTELEPQLERAYAAYRAAPTDLAKHIYMWRLHDNNVTLFYAVLQRQMLEMLPVVYDPVVGEAIENYSEVITRPRGVFLSIGDPDSVEKKLADFGAAPDDIDLLEASDAEEILNRPIFGWQEKMPALTATALRRKSDHSGALTALHVGHAPFLASYHCKFLVKRGIAASSLTVSQISVSVPSRAAWAPR